MKMNRNVEKSKATTTKKIATVFYYSCSRHILITFVGITLLIVNYGVDTVQMSDVPHGSENSSNCKSKSINCNKSYNNNTNDGSSSSSIMSTKNGCNINDTNNNSGSIVYTKMIWKRNDKNIMKINTIKQHTSDINDSSKNINENIYRNVHFLQIPLPVIPPTDNTIRNRSNYACDDNNDNYLDSRNVKLKNFRKARIFGLLGTNFSLSYNLSIGTGNSAGNITIAAPAPAYYYAPAPYYPYGYGYGYNPYAYNPYAYNPYAYNPYAYNPYDGYGYYG